MKVAIDGPAGSGKSTICKLLAQKYNLIYLDTGAMYRAATFIRAFFDYTGETLFSTLKNTTFNFRNEGRELALVIDGKEYEVTEAIRTPDITRMVSDVASIPEVRAILTEKQREIAKTADVILDGRDITTVVLPDAEVKVFLTASAEERAMRRFKEWKGTHKESYENILKDIQERDRKDSERDVAPLMKAPDAVEVDTTSLTIEQVVTIIGKIIEKNAKQ